MVSLRQVPMGTGDLERRGAATDAQNGVRVEDSSAVHRADSTLGHGTDPAATGPASG